MTITVEELIKSIVGFVRENSSRESMFLTADPQWELNAAELLDHISSVSGISKEQISKWVDEFEKEGEGEEASPVS